jgi:hypothetical protein
MKTIHEFLRKVASIYQRDWDERLPVFLHAYRISIHETTSLTPGGSFDCPVT